jgi:hypothetical protein
MSSQTATTARTWKRPPFISNPTLRYGLLVGTLIYLYFAIGAYDVNWSRVYEGLDRGWRFISAFSHPDFVTRWTDIREGLIESIIMTITSDHYFHGCGNCNLGSYRSGRGAQPCTHAGLFDMQRHHCGIARLA